MTQVVYTMGAVKINSTTIKQVSEHSLDPMFSLFELKSGGSPDVSLYAINELAPEGSWTSTAVGEMLAALGLGWVTISTALELYWHQLALGGSRTSGSTHAKLSVTKGTVVAGALSCSHGAIAQMGGRFKSAYDGVNNPFTWASGVALPTGTFAADNKFTLGPIKIGTTLYDLQSMSIDPNIEFFTLGKSGLPNNDMTAVMSRSVKGQVTFSDPAFTDIITEIGGPQAGAKLFLRKITAQGHRVLDATAEHIAITLPNACFYPGPHSVSEGEVGVATAIFAAADDGTNSPVTVSTGSAIA